MRPLLGYLNQYRFALIAVFLLVTVAPALAQTFTTDAPAAQKTWEILLKLAFPIVMTAVGPLVTGLIKTAPAPVKYALAALSSMLVGAGVGSIPDFPLTPESAATIGVTSGATGQAIFNMIPKPPASASSSPSAFWLPLLLATGVLSLTACASYIDYGDGRYGVTRVSEQRSPFGTNAGFAYLENCEGRKDNIGALQFTDCKPINTPQIISSQGQGGQIVGGALTGIGFGLGNAFGGASNSASATSSAVSAPAKGGHH